MFSQKGIKGQWKSSSGAYYVLTNNAEGSSGRESYPLFIEAQSEWKKKSKVYPLLSSVRSPPDYPLGPLNLAVGRVTWTLVYPQVNMDSPPDGPKNTSKQKLRFLLSRFKVQAVSNQIIILFDSLSQIFFFTGTINTLQVIAFSLFLLRSSSGCESNQMRRRRLELNYG